MSEITLALEHPSLGCGEIIARYDLSKIQEKAYQQGIADERERIVSEIKKWYMDSNKQKLADDPCVVDAMIDLFIRTVRGGENDVKEYQEHKMVLELIEEAEKVQKIVDCMKDLIAMRKKSTDKET